MHKALSSPQTIHPSLWRGSQLAQGRERCVDTGHAGLSAELPGGGWPRGTLIDLLIQQPGIGEVRLLQPALATLRTRPIVLLQPPHVPNALAVANWGVPPDNFHRIETGSVADALWAAEQILRAGTCGMLLFWQPQIRNDALRRLHLAAQAGDTVFFMMRPMTAAPHASPAPLRLGLTPAFDGVSVRFIKRRGPARDEPLFVPLSPSLFKSHRHAPVDRRPSSVPVAGSISADVVA
ncbi:translesion DNA synthesis-associated protein ImuA [Robbsia sp. Bb-Pol-6]|uniref:Translesion DNA synthesis-associated protein ImuA n=1 Tax=Robbsia betulipollinis TaxID=2981849 RepID=A0ABT3ZUI7_9BURK|nr:translesion DNA synthesis-associated protein ImuA [Robbsia betulipollinis]MCY0389880.1 translesion DNA synthesis-associated protein ImuA [Robbsia betulipollinis]